MNILGKLAFKLGKGYFFKQLEKEDFKKKIVQIVNEKVNIPKLNEKQERQLFSAVYDAIKSFFLIG